jgi:hypothetical protein
LGEKWIYRNISIQRRRKRVLVRTRRVPVLGPPGIEGVTWRQGQGNSSNGSRQPSVHKGLCVRRLPLEVTSDVDKTVRGTRRFEYPISRTAMKEYYWKTIVSRAGSRKDTWSKPMNDERPHVPCWFRINWEGCLSISIEMVKQIEKLIPQEA